MAKFIFFKKPQLQNLFNHTSSVYSFDLQHSCQSDGNAIYFHGTEGSELNFATTRDIDLSSEDAQEQWAEEFESQPKGWVIIILQNYKDPCNVFVWWEIKKFLYGTCTVWILCFNNTQGIQRISWVSKLFASKLFLLWIKTSQF